jgi:hypothetical protein
MTGGLMNLVAYGNENLLFNGNPKKTFFNATYQKYTNFGLQRFRIDFEGTKTLNDKTNTILHFKIPRYSELLMDTYFVINLPHIYSPFYNFQSEESTLTKNNTNHQFVPYEFRWIEELGTNMIEEVEVYSGGLSLAKYSGEYLNCIKERDYTTEKKNLWNRMTGNISELNDPANSNGSINTYPNVQWTSDSNDIEPSIRGRQLFIPLDAFFCESSKTALPLVALQYQEISIKIILKPLMDLYTINNVNDEPDIITGLTYRIQPNKNILDHQLWRFLQPPKDISASTILYNQNTVDWKADVHLIGTYAFLGQSERRIFAAKEHKVLIKQVYTYDYLDVGGSKIVEIESKDMVSNYMWRFRRSDAYLRNEWSNYTNWAYNHVIPKTLEIHNLDLLPNPSNYFMTGNILNNDGSDYPVNVKEIMLNLGITMDGVYREKVFPSGVYEYMEKFMRTSGGGKDGLYCYNFGLDSNRRKYQPSGAMNVNKFKKVFFEFNTIEPPIDIVGSNNEFICDNEGNAIGFRKTTGKLNEYNFDLRIFEERYNVMIITGGKVGLLHAR